MFLVCEVNETVEPLATKFIYIKVTVNHTLRSKATYKKPK